MIVIGKPCTCGQQTKCPNVVTITGAGRAEIQVANLVRCGKFKRQIDAVRRIIVERGGEMSEQLYDTLSVDMETNKVTLMGEGKTARNAEAIEKFAIMRSGTDEAFYISVPAGKYQDGDTWNHDDVDLAL